ncbi:MAG: cbb3-type cytochrome c oxidase N-terminal domain-containing protein [Flavobacterium sp.]
MKKIFPVYVRVPLLFAIVLGVMEYFIDSGDQPAFIKYPMVGVFLLMFLFLLIAIEIVVKAIENLTFNMLSEEQKRKYLEAEELSFTESSFYKKIMDKLTRSKSVEAEADIMLEHDYDGIHELDNVLPPWWVYLFYITVIFSIVYLIRYHISGADNQEQEFAKEMEKAKIEVAEYMKTAPDVMDKEKVILLTDAESLAAGKAIYTTNCVACHRADGGGQIGPNLTDNLWINGGGIKNVFNTIMEGGRDGKGMVPWKDIIKPTDIQKVSSYVLSLQGTNPKDAKPGEPEAKEWKEEGEAAPTASSTPATDSTAVAK